MKKKEEDYTEKMKFGRNYIRIKLKVTQPGGTFVKYLHEAFTRSYTHHTPHTIALEYPTFNSVIL